MAGPSFAKTAWDDIKQNSGVVEKAIIEVIDLGIMKAPDRAAAAEVEKKSVGDSMAAKANKSTGKALVNQDMLISNYVDMRMKPAVSSIAAKVAGNQFTKKQADKKIDELRKKMTAEAVGNKTILANGGRKYFTVQFNPSTLQISGHAGGLVQKLSYDKEDKDKDGREDSSATLTAGTTSIIMSVSLLFDSCDNQDAFLDDKLTLNPTNVGKGIAKAAMSATGNKKTSVQTEVEGFIAALRNPNTRLMTFNWGRICYSGVLRSVGVNYTMFNPLGEPVRATVDLSIVCADDDQWPNSVGIWQLRYASAFSKGSESFVKTEQKVGSLLNL